MSKRRDYSEPWSPQAILIETVLDPENVDVNNYTKRQAKALAEAETYFDLIEEYISSDIVWPKKLLKRYKANNKSVNGWSVKIAERVARVPSTRMNLVLSRLKKVFDFGSEG